MKTYHQGDISFIPLALFGKSGKDVRRDTPLRSTPSRLLIQEGEITGHHHGCWFVPQPAYLHDGALARSLEVAVPAPPLAMLYQDDALTKALALDAGSPIIGYLVADDEITVRHASAEGHPTGEHDDVVLPVGTYLVTGKREFTAGDERRVAD